MFHRYDWMSNMKNLVCKFGVQRGEYQYVEGGNLMMKWRLGNFGGIIQLGRWLDSQSIGKADNGNCRENICTRESSGGEQCIRCGWAGVEESRLRWSCIANREITTCRAQWWNMIWNADTTNHVSCRRSSRNGRMYSITSWWRCWRVIYDSIGNSVGYKGAAWTGWLPSRCLKVILSMGHFPNHLLFHFHSWIFYPNIPICPITATPLYLNIHHKYKGKLSWSWS